MKRTRPPVTRPICGTLAGWNSHVRHGEFNCDACKTHHTTYMREWRRRTGRNSSSLYTDEQIAAIRAEVPQPALDFINQRSEYVRAARQPVGDNDADYWRWQGHMEARRQLAQMLGYTVPYEPGEQTEKVSHEAVPTGAASSIPKENR